MYCSHSWPYTCLSIKSTLLIFKIQFLQKPSLYTLGELVRGIVVLRNVSYIIDTMCFIGIDSGVI